MAIFGIFCIVYLVISLIIFVSVLSGNTTGSIFDSIIIVIAAGMGFLWPLWVVYYIVEFLSNLVKKKE